MKNQKGITLVTLIITIVVTLILAMTSIAMLTDDDGTVTKSQNLEKEVEKKQNKYIEELNEMLTNLHNIMNPSSSNAIQVIQEGELSWSNGKATIKLKVVKDEYEVDGYNIQYQINSTSGTWNNYSESITNLSHNNTVWVRALKDSNVVYDTTKSIKILDKTEPQEATITFDANIANGECPNSATVTHVDNESGINIASCKWILNHSATLIGKNKNSYTNSFTSNGQAITLSDLKTNATTSWYLHVLSVDNAGNAKETVKGPIEGKQTVETLINVAVTENTKAEDAYGNKITIPKGFKVLPNSTGTTTGDVTYSYSGNNIPAVQDGIVIEDTQEGTAGNQFVWVPVGTIKNKNNTTTTITLGRYSNFTMTNGEVASGQPVQVASLTNYTQEVAIGTYFKEQSTFREGNIATDSTAKNATARDLKTFIETSLANGGYYMARYEAGITGTEDNNSLETSTATDGSVKPQSKYGLGVWNSINQPNAAKVARAMYGEVKDTSGNLLYASDLVNSYAWDTAIIFIQKMGNSNYANAKDEGGKKNNTGVSGDVKCNIYDMAKNTREFSTEYSSYSNSQCTIRGGDFNRSDLYTCIRNYYNTTGVNERFAFRSLLYVK